MYHCYFRKVGEEEKFGGLFRSAIKSCTDGIAKIRIQLARERALKRFHQLRLESLPTLWKEVFSELGVPEDNAVILQSINQLLFNSIVLEGLGMQLLPRKLLPARRYLAMYSDEQNAVRYASGYVVKVLKKQYEKRRE